jgi:hypothetical protein
MAAACLWTRAAFGAARLVAQIDEESVMAEIDAKTLAKIDAALAAAEAMYAEIENPTRNLGDQWAYFKELIKPVKAARRALK